MRAFFVSGNEGNALDILRVDSRIIKIRTLW